MHTDQVDRLATLIIGVMFFCGICTAVVQQETAYIKALLDVGGQQPGRYLAPADQHQPDVASLEQVQHHPALFLMPKEVEIVDHHRIPGFRVCLCLGNGPFFPALGAGKVGIPPLRLCIYWQFPDWSGSQCHIRW